MRIAILTLPLHTNYGGILQAYALQTILQRVGHEVVHLQPVQKFHSLHPAWKMPLVWMKRCLIKCFDSWNQPVFEHPDKFVRKHTDVFIHQHLNIKALDDMEWNEELSHQYDAFLVGSDQVWRSAYAYPLSRYFLSFLSPQTQSLRVAYAASFGQDPCDLTTEQLTECAPLLQRFSAVSVREESGVRICKEQFQVDALQVLDPTMLLGKEDYLALASLAKPSPGKLMVYVLDENAQVNQWVDKMARLSGLQPFRVNSKVENDCAKLTERQQPPVEQWLRGFADAEYVLTDSFHGCVFSIIFGKPFLCIGNPKRGLSRFHSLLQQFGLENCLVSFDPSFERFPSPDMVEAKRRLEVARSQSMFFLSSIFTGHEKTYR